VADKAKLNLKGEMINTWCIHDEFDLNDYRFGWVESGCLKSLKKENTIPWKINNLTRETKFKPAKFGFHWQTQYELHKTRNCTTRAGIWIQSANNVYAWNQKWKILKEQVWLG
jgi:hypothetical protein